MVVFAAIGSMLFWMYSAAAVDSKPEISVSDEFIQRLVAEREMVLERELSSSEVDTIRQNFIDQEVLVREAMARGLYLNDGQVRHRLADKMFFLLAGEIDAPSEPELSEFFGNRQDDYRTPELISFSHRFFGVDKARVDKALSSSGQVVDEGDPFYMGQEIFRSAPAELIAVFGLDFTRALGELRVGEWSGPLRSGRGWHLVRVDAYQPQRRISREELGERLILDWREAQLAAIRQARMEQLRSNYRIVDRDSIHVD